jgi:hypothetical protein
VYYLHGINWYKYNISWLSGSLENKSKEFLHEKIAKRQKQIHRKHNPRFNHDLQLEIDCIECVLNKIEVNKVPDDRLEGIISAVIKILEKRKDNAMKRSDTDDFSIKIERLQWGSICYLC